MVLENEKNARLGRFLLLSRLLFFAGLALTVAGGALEGSDNNDDVLTGVKLVKAGYFIVLVFLLCLLAVQGYFWQRSSRLSKTAQTVCYPKIGLIYYVLTVDGTGSESYGSGYAIHGCSHHLPLPFGL